MPGNPRFDTFVAQQGTKNLPTGSKIDSLLNTHPVSTHARFAINWTKTFWDINDRKPSHWCTVYPKKYAHGFCFAVLCCGYTLIFPYPSGLLHWHCGNLTIAPVPAKQPWWIWINTSCEFIMNDCITTTKQSTTKPCAYFLGYTVRMLANGMSLPTFLAGIIINSINIRHKDIYIYKTKCPSISCFIMGLSIPWDDPEDSSEMKTGSPWTLIIGWN